VHCEKLKNIISSIIFDNASLKIKTQNKTNTPRVTPATTGNQRATNSTNKKQGKGEKQILIGQRARRINCSEHRRHWRTASGNTCRHPVKM
jgi:hypothetical protein